MLINTQIVVAIISGHIFYSLFWYYRTFLSHKCNEHPTQIDRVGYVIKNVGGFDSVHIFLSEGMNELIHSVGAGLSCAL